MKRAMPFVAPFYKSDLNAKILSLGCLILFLSVGCKPKSPYTIVRKASYTIQAVPRLPSHVYMTQWQGTSSPPASFRFVAQVELSPATNNLVMVAFSTLGRRLFVLRRQAGRMSFVASPGYTPPIPSAVLIEHLQHCLWPLAAVQRGWAHTRNRWVRVSQKPLRYALKLGNQVILERTHPSPNQCRLVHHEPAYTIQVAIQPR
ncbi:MAG: DUF3261 domain-containing protein [Deltaproteobacteria bacterium]|nr:MAG: DUF3261 domain-containing protein [Deltaproteobacteria bacterium]